MSDHPIPVTLIGATGLTGSAALLSLLTTTTQALNILTLTRRPAPQVPPANTSTTHDNRVVADLFAAPLDTTLSVAEKGGVFVSCLGTMRAKAGGVEGQRKIDVELNKAFADRAKRDGASTYILVSSGGANAGSHSAYFQMKGELEDHVKAMGWEHLVILRPGMLLGPREDSQGAEFVLQKVFRGLRGIGFPGAHGMSIEGSDVGQCIAHLVANPPAEQIKVVSNAEIVATAKAWRDANGKV